MFIFQADFDLSIFQKRFNATLKMMIFTLNNGSLPYQVKRFTNDGKTDFFIVYASSDAINNTLQFVSILTTVVCIIDPIRLKWTISLTTQNRFSVQI